MARSQLQKAQYHRDYYLGNKEAIKEQARKWAKENQELIRSRKPKYRREFVLKHRKEINLYNSKYNANKRRTDVSFHLQEVLRNRLFYAVKKDLKAGSAVKDLGCTVPQLKFYLEEKFQDGMNWDNWGYNGWHIDHIIPLAYFDLTNREQFIRACHYTNLQPLWAKENFKKGSRLPALHKTI